MDQRECDPYTGRAYIHAFGLSRMSAKTTARPSSPGLLTGHLPLSNLLRLTCHDLGIQIMIHLTAAAGQPAASDSQSGEVRRA